jgi:hypothetical protein
MKTTTTVYAPHNRDVVHVITTPRGFHQNGAYRSTLCGLSPRRFWNTVRAATCPRCKAKATTKGEDR